MLCNRSKPAAPQQYRRFCRHLGTALKNLLSGEIIQRFRPVCKEFFSADPQFVVFHECSEIHILYFGTNCQEPSALFSSLGEANRQYTQYDRRTAAANCNGRSVSCCLCAPAKHRRNAQDRRFRVFGEGFIRRVPSASSGAHTGPWRSLRSPRRACRHDPGTRGSDGCSGLRSSGSRGNRRPVPCCRP